MRTSPWRAEKKVVVDPHALAWAGIGAAAIGYEIALAASGHRGHTLSAYVRKALGLNPRQRWAPAGVTVLTAGLLWLGVHLSFGILPRN
jgi:hypothetical protein